MARNMENEEGGISKALSNQDNDKLNRKSKGCLAIDNKYKINSRSTMEISLEEHRLLPDIMPKDPNKLIANLQKFVPFNIFDPNASEVLTVYVDEDVKITFTTTQDVRPNPIYEHKKNEDIDNEKNNDRENEDIPKELPARYNNVLSIYIRKSS